LHNRYGPVVRTSPNELSYIGPELWKEIYGHKSAGEEEFAKDKNYHAGIKGEPVILNADKEYHSYLRKLLAHGFSEKALRGQEPVIQRYVDLLIQKLHEVGQDGSVPVDMLAWYNVSVKDLVR
jgi:cytochrome P450